jgi:hypothetical protein
MLATLSCSLVLCSQMLSIAKPWLVHKAPANIVHGSRSVVQVSALLKRLLRSDVGLTASAKGNVSPSSDSVRGSQDDVKTTSSKSMRSYNMGPNGDIYRATATSTQGSADSKRPSKREAADFNKDETKVAKLSVPKTRRDSEIQRAAESLTTHTKVKKPSQKSLATKASQSKTSGSELAPDRNRFSRIPSSSEPGRLSSLSASNSHSSSPAPITIVKNRPFTIPSGMFRPKQSLGQNFLSDQNYVNKIVDAFSDDSPVSNCLNGFNVKYHLISIFVFLYVIWCITATERVSRRGIGMWARCSDSTAVQAVSPNGMPTFKYSLHRIFHFYTF